MPELPGDTSFFKTSWWVIFCFSFLTYARLSVSNLTIQSAGDRYYVCTDLMEKCHVKLTKIKQNYSFTCFNLLVELSIISRKESRVKEIWATLLYYVIRTALISTVTTCNTSNGKNYEMAN